MSAASALEVKGVRSGYGEAPVLRDVSFDVRPGEIFALLGKNAAAFRVFEPAKAGLPNKTSTSTINFIKSS